MSEDLFFYVGALYVDTLFYVCVEVKYCQHELFDGGIVLMRISLYVLAVA